THTTGGVQTSYGYDDIDQLVSESRNGYSASYSYDANGNRLTRTVNSVTEDYVYDDADKLLEVKVGQQTVKEFTYDSAGRTTAVETSAGTTSLTYDYESRVTGITYPNQSTNSFSYNGLDTRVGLTDSGGSKTFLRDGVSVTSPVLSDGAATYTPGISERRSSTTTFYHAGIKNGDSQSNTSESVTASVQYDAFGNVTSSSGTWSGPFAYGGPYGYQSDPDSGLKLLGHRYYDPSTGRFLTRDIVKSERNWYSYCHNSPLRFADPKGFDKIILPNDPSGLPDGWKEIPHDGNEKGHRRFIAPGGREGLDFDEAKPGAGGHKERNHWHKLKRKGLKLKREKGGRGEDVHLDPGQEIDVNTEPVCPAPEPESMWDHVDWNQVFVRTAIVVAVLAAVLFPEAIPVIISIGARSAPRVGRVLVP
ncbi:MAG: hypothetical protein KJZ62_11060, partial [Fimbriimonadaceae bacterium]|nr:hypothetical protein [Fimbriimonadaceae bacterium]